MAIVPTINMPVVPFIGISSPLEYKDFLVEDVTLVELLSPSDASLLHELVKIMATNDERAKAGVDLTKVSGLQDFWGRVTEALDSRLQAMIDKKAIKCKARLVSAIYIEFHETGHNLKDPHYDDNDITVNLCLENAATGGRVAFMDPSMTLAQFRDVSEALTDGEFFESMPQLMMTHQSGVACIHYGKHVHTTELVTMGSRANVVIKYDYESFDGFCDLPVELQLRILYFCDVRTLGKACQANKFMKDLANDEWLWHQVYTDNAKMQGYLNSSTVEEWRRGEHEAPLDSHGVAIAFPDTNGGRPPTWKALYDLMLKHIVIEEEKIAAAARKKRPIRRATTGYFARPMLSEM